MDQKKTGYFLKQLRNEKKLTQEQLAEKFQITSRTVSRWETGSNMPDISMLLELADFYEVDIREIIDGERKSEQMNEELKETVIKVTDYTETNNARLLKRVRIIGITGVITCGNSTNSILEQNAEVESCRLIPENRWKRFPIFVIPA